MELALFWILAVGAVACALLVIVPPRRNPLYSAFALVGVFVCLAGLYLLLVAHLVAVLQILVYAGAIMVLFIFVIMLLNLQPQEAGPTKVGPARVLGAVAAMFVVIRLAVMLTPASELPVADLTDPVATTITGQPVEYGTVKHVGDSLFRDFLVPFELLSLVLLVAIIGAVVLARRKPVTTHDETTSTKTAGQEAP